MPFFLYLLQHLVFGFKPQAAEQTLSQTEVFVKEIIGLLSV